MIDQVQLLIDALASKSQEKEPQVWEDLLAAVQEITSAELTQKIESLLVAALGFETKADSPFPPPLARRHGEVTGYAGSGKMGCHRTSR